MSGFVEIVTTTGDADSARRIATYLVGHGLVACAQMGGPITSTYRWQGAVETSEEWTLTLKTRATRQDEVTAALIALHEYETPQVVVLPILGGSPGYLEWLGQSVGA